MRPQYSRMTQATKNRLIRGQKRLIERLTQRITEPDCSAESVRILLEDLNVERAALEAIESEPVRRTVKP
jgi:hypothetical protein